MIIQTRNIQKTFGSLQVLKGIDLEVEKGEIVSIVGKSGAGKTTLLQIMGTLLDANEGEVSILGTDIRALKEKELYGIIEYVLGKRLKKKKSWYNRIIDKFRSIFN